MKLEEEREGKRKEGGDIQSSMSDIRRLSREREYNGLRDW